MKKRVKKLARGTVLSTGVTFKKALKVLVPPEILQNSSFFGGLNRMGDAVVDLGKESEKSQKNGKQYVLRKSGGIVADTAIGVAFFGVPITLVTSLFSDGCKVASQILKGAITDDHDVVQLGNFLGDMSDVSNNFMRLFDIPSKDVADDVQKSIDQTIKNLKREGQLSKKLSKDLRDLERMAIHLERKAKFYNEIQEKLQKIAEEGLRNSKAKTDTKKIHLFLESPSTENITQMRDGLINDFKVRGVRIRKNTMDFINSLVDSLEAFSTDEFHHKLREFMIKQYELADITQYTIEHSAYHAYKFVHSLLHVTYKGVSVFGRHYKRQIECLTGYEKSC